MKKYKMKKYEIYQSFLRKIGKGWFTPYNCNQFMGNGEYTICADLHEYGLLRRKKENEKWMFKKINRNEKIHNQKRNYF